MGGLPERDMINLFIFNIFPLNLDVRKLPLIVKVSVSQENVLVNISEAQSHFQFHSDRSCFSLILRVDMPNRLLYCKFQNFLLEDAVKRRTKLTLQCASFLLCYILQFIYPKLKKIFVIFIYIFFVNNYLMSIPV